MNQADAHAQTDSEQRSENLRRAGKFRRFRQSINRKSAQRLALGAGKSRCGQPASQADSGSYQAAFGQLNERSQEIGKIAKTVDDLAHRTNMIALNASIQTEDASRRTGRGISVVVEEIERLAARAGNTNKQISDCLTNQSRRKSTKSKVLCRQPSAKRRIFPNLLSKPAIR